MCLGVSALLLTSCFFFLVCCVFKYQNSFPRVPTLPYLPVVAYKETENKDLKRMDWNLPLAGVQDRNCQLVLRHDI